MAARCALDRLAGEQLVKHAAGIEQLEARRRELVRQLDAVEKEMTERRGELAAALAGTPPALATAMRERLAILAGAIAELHRPRALAAHVDAERVGNGNGHTP